MVLCSLFLALSTFNDFFCFQNAVPYVAWDNGLHVWLLLANLQITDSLNFNLYKQMGSDLH